MGLIFDIKRFAIHDGPGVRTTVFFKGCPLSCGPCHNPESQAAEREIILRRDRCIRCEACLPVCPSGALSPDGGGVGVDRDTCRACGACAEACLAGALELAGREVTAAEVMEEVRKDRVFYDTSGGGVTFSGGEPLYQPDFLGALLEACGEEEIHRALDTSGYAPREVLERVSGGVDLFLYDLKVMDDDRHRALTGVSNEPILRNLRWLVGEERATVVRFPLIPGVNDDEENLEGVGAFLSSLPRRCPLQILPYHRAGIEKYARLDRPYDLPDARPPDVGRVAETARVLRGFGLEVLVGGGSNGAE